MKKIMIAAAIVCAASLSQAACIDWAVPNSAWTLADGSSKAAKNTIVYLINGDTSLDTIAAAVSAGNITEQSWFYGSALTDNTKGRIPENKVSSANLANNTFYNFSALMVDNDKYMVSKAFNQMAYKDGEEAMAVSFAASYLNSNAQTAALEGAQNGWANVPEPTSAMLLLLGVAGLALRRRRA